VTAPRTPPAPRLSLAVVRARYVDAGRALPARLEAALATDPRAGARAILAAVERRRYANRSEGQRLRTMLRYENAVWATGVAHVASRVRHDAKETASTLRRQSECVDVLGELRRIKN